MIKNANGDIIGAIGVSGSSVNCVYFLQTSFLIFQIGIYYVYLFLVMAAYNIFYLVKNNCPVAITYLRLNIGKH